MVITGALSWRRRGQRASSRRPREGGAGAARLPDPADGADQPCAAPAPPSRGCREEARRPRRRRYRGPAAAPAARPTPRRAGPSPRRSHRARPWPPTSSRPPAPQDLACVLEQERVSLEERGRRRGKEKERRKERKRKRYGEEEKRNVFDEMRW